MKTISCNQLPRLITVAILLLCSIAVKAQSKPDTTAKYKLSEQQVLQISNLLSYADKIAGNSDKITTREYNEFNRQIVQVDSFLRVQYLKMHPVKNVKKP